MPKMMPLAVRRPLRAEDVARRVAIDHLRRVAADAPTRDAGALRVGRRSDEREPIAVGTERRAAVR